jgi:MFS family permease
MVLFAQLGADSGYALHVLPALLIMGLGLGFVFAPAMAIATLGVAARETGIASAMVNTAQQVGGSIGTALLSTFFASAVTSYLTDNGPRAVEQAQISGYTTAFWWSAGIFAIGTVISALLLRGGVQEVDPEAEPVFAH